ncbi:MAG: hypothetical protein WAM42_22840, partial [Candidatus Nitrosopolaris sp.]
STEDTIEEEQSNVRGFLQKISEKKQENHKRIARAVAMDSQMRSLNSVFKKLNKDIQKPFDLDHLRNVAKLGGSRLYKAPRDEGTEAESGEGRNQGSHRGHL